MHHHLWFTKGLGRSDPGAQMLRIGGGRAQRLGCDIKQQARAVLTTCLQWEPKPTGACIPWILNGKAGTRTRGRSFAINDLLNEKGGETSWSPEIPEFAGGLAGRNLGRQGYLSKHCRSSQWPKSIWGRATHSPRNPISITLAFLRVPRAL
jgi:hypothetical protein